MTGEPAQAPDDRTLGKIEAVLTTAPDLVAVEAAYTHILGYQVVERGVVSSECAETWGAPAVAGRPMLSLRPAAGEATLLRFVQQAQPPGLKPMTSWGWNATEIIVQDCDQTGERLKGTAFRTVAPPRPLAGSDGIRAMQAIGPANEMLYLTSTTGQPSPDMPIAESAIGRCFIAVAGGPDVVAMSTFYRDLFGATARAPINTPIRSLSIQNVLPPDTRYDMAVIPLGDGSLLELDGYPSGALARPRMPGELPAGMAAVSFACHAFDRYIMRMVAPPQAAETGPFRGRRTGVVIGAAGEWIELVEA
jgi:hypothetical protein